MVHSHSALTANDYGMYVIAASIFVPAGADVATTCSYQASVEGFSKVGLSVAEAEGLLRRSVHLADAARSDRQRQQGPAQPGVICWPWSSHTDYSHRASLLPKFLRSSSFPAVSFTAG